MSYNDKLIYLENYYRLKIIDNIGTITYSDIISLNGEIINTFIYPNPTKNILNINTDKIITNIKIFDNLGKEILNINTPTNQIILPDIPNGVYYIKIEIESNTIVNKLIKI